jgi:REP element-mobilizing transposase RayT
MSRPLRIQFPNAWYHVLNRGRRREHIYKSKEDFFSFLDLLKEASTMFTVNISGYCLMNNHYHLLIQTPRANISRFMRHVDGVYTQKFNRRYKLDGSLFRGRYKSILIEKDDHLLEVLRYIHRNPIKARLETELGNYPWYSYRIYLPESVKWDWIYKEFLLGMFSDSRSNAVNQYKKYMQRESPREVVEFFNRKKQSPVFGSSEFMEKIKKLFSNESLTEEITERKVLLPEASDIKRVVRDFYQISDEDLLVSKRNTFNEPRNMAIYIVKQLRGDKLIDIASHFGMEKYSSVSSVINRFKEKLKSDKKLLKKYNNILSILNSNKSQAKT